VESWRLGDDFNLIGPLAFSIAHRDVGLRWRTDCQGLQFGVFIGNVAIANWRPPKPTPMSEEHMPLYLIERNFAEQLQLTPEGGAAVKQVQRRRRH
jgi:hypothetical protein